MARSSCRRAPDPRRHLRGAVPDGDGRCVLPVLTTPRLVVALDHRGALVEHRRGVHLGDDRRRSSRTPLPAPVRAPPPDAGVPRPGTVAVCDRDAHRNDRTAAPSPGGRPGGPRRRDPPAGGRTAARARRVAEPPRPPHPWTLRTRPRVFASDRRGDGPHPERARQAAVGRSAPRRRQDRHCDVDPQQARQAHGCGVREGQVASRRGSGVGRAARRLARRVRSRRLGTSRAIRRKRVPQRPVGDRHLLRRSRRVGGRLLRRDDLGAVVQAADVGRRGPGRTRRVLRGPSSIRSSCAASSTSRSVASG